MDNEVDIEIKEMQNADAQPHRFVWRFEYDETASVDAGRPIYKPTVFVEVISAEGECRDVKYVRANELHKRKFAVAWRRFRENIAPEIDMGVYDPLTVHELKQMFPDAYKQYCARVAKQTGGTLLCEWNQCPVKTALELKYMGIFTVEDLIDSEPAIVSDELRQAAIEYVATSADAGRINTLARSLIQAKAIIDRQAQQIAAMQQKINNQGV